MTPQLIAALEERELWLVHLVSLAFDSGTGYYTDAHKDLTLGGDVYISSGALLSIPELEQSISDAGDTLDIKVSAVNTAQIALALSDDFRAAQGEIYRGILDQNADLVTDPELIFKGIIDRYELDEDTESSTLTWTLRKETSYWRSINGRRTSNGSQNIHFPGDEFFEFSGHNVEGIVWGEGRRSTDRRFPSA